MKGRKPIDSGSVCHIYQRTVNGFQLFYCVKDYLIFYTIVAIAARRYGIKVLGLCQMPDHLHLLVMAPDMLTVSRFIQYCNSLYTKAFNEEYGTSGQLFEAPFGIAVKKGDKKIRTAIAYLYNNPVEKRLNSSAAAYQWNYLAYADSRHPFSEWKNLAQSRYVYRCAARMIKTCLDAGLPLNYQVLSSCFDGLSGDEKKMLADRIVCAYHLVDYPALLSYYGNYRTMIVAIDSNTGSEYDIVEEFLPGSDKVYHRLVTEAMNRFGPSAVAILLGMKENARRRSAIALQQLTGATLRQVCKFLHLAMQPADSQQNRHFPTPLRRG